MTAALPDLVKQVERETRAVRDRIRRDEREIVGHRERVRQAEAKVRRWQARIAEVWEAQAAAADARRQGTIAPILWSVARALGGLLRAIVAMLSRRP
jgi:hypothetical protein